MFLIFLRSFSEEEYFKKNCSFFYWRDLKRQKNRWHPEHLTGHDQATTFFSSKQFPFGQLSNELILIGASKDSNISFNFLTLKINRKYFISLHAPVMFSKFVKLVTFFSALSEWCTKSARSLWWCQKLCAERSRKLGTAKAKTFLATFPLILIKIWVTNNQSPFSQINFQALNISEDFAFNK